MEQVRAVQQPSEQAHCVACGHPLLAPRCESCGVAQWPGGFTVKRVLAQSPHSRVYLAEDESGRPVALKELLFALVPDVKQVEAFEREAKLLEELSHPRIPRFVKSFREGEGVGTRLYLAQEFVRGTSLEEALKGRRTYSEEEAAAIAKEALELLAFLHSRTPRVLHRDVKPANLIVRESGELALVDFGAARAHATGATFGSTLVGTFGYMPPEQLGGTVDVTSDLYALGATLLHLLTGTPPSELVSERATLDAKAILKKRAPKLAAFVAKLTAVKRQERYPSAEAALKALADAMSGRAKRMTVRPAVVICGVLMAVCTGGVLLAGPYRDLVDEWNDKGYWGKDFRDRPTWARVFLGEDETKKQVRATATGSIDADLHALVLEESCNASMHLNATNFSVIRGGMYAEDGKLMSRQSVVYADVAVTNQGQTSCYVASDALTLRPLDGATGLITAANFRRITLRPGEWTRQRWSFAVSGWLNEADMAIGGAETPQLAWHLDFLKGTLTEK